MEDAAQAVGQRLCEIVPRLPQATMDCDYAVEQDSARYNSGHDEESELHADLVVDGSRAACRDDGA